MVIKQTFQKFKKVEIGFYNHDQNIENKAKLSIVSLHGMDQGRFNWPNAWKKQDGIFMILVYYLEKNG